MDVYRAGMINTVPLGANTITRIFASRIPQACQTCKGLGCTCPRFCERADDHICPDCPTIGTLLLYGWNVATARVNGGQVRINGRLWMTAPNLLAALREVPTP